MTEQEWLECNRMKPMLEYLQDKAGDRKLRLFACACVRQKWRWLNNSLRESVEVTESYADGLVTQSTLRQSHQASWAKAPSMSLHCACFVNHDSINLMLQAAEVIRSPLRCLLLRDIFGPLLFLPVILDPAWLTWHDSLLVSMARQMYDSRDFSDMPVLGDALEEAGCTDADILNHCRQPGEHVRGCWVVDLLLGKE
jgi:hypothetical protein